MSGEALNPAFIANGLRIARYHELLRAQNARMPVVVTWATREGEVMRCINLLSVTTKSFTGRDAWGTEWFRVNLGNVRKVRV